LGHMRITFRKHGLSHHPAPHNFHGKYAYHLHSTTN
jgi:hypothetical protein